MNNQKKIFLSLLSFCLMCNICFAQDNIKQDYRKFTNAFSSKVSFPVELMRNCTPTVCLIKINVDSAKNVVAMQLSDSADSLLVLEFNKHKSSLDLKPLERYLKNYYESNNGTVYLIPFSYGMLPVNCSSQVVNLSILNNYNKFNGEYLIGSVVLLDPIYIKVGVQR